MRRRNVSRRVIIQSLEPRQLLSVSVATPLTNVAVPIGTSNSTVDLSHTFADPDLTGTIVQMRTNQGTINLELYDSQAPLTVANFLSYVNSSTFNFNNTVIYRVIPNFVIQTGTDYPYDPNQQPITASTAASDQVAAIATPHDLDSSFTPPTVQNEFDPNRSNLRGTIAMAKLSGNPNSASTEWFINLADNSSNLDNQNGGFTVFGKVIGNGMQVADTIGSLPTLGGSGGYSSLPLVNYTTGNVTAGNLVMTQSMSVIPAITYTATSSNSAIVNPTISGTGLSLSYGSQPGTANVTITATDAAGFSVNNTFGVTVEAPSISVTHNNQNVISGQTSPIDFGVIGQNATAQQTLMVTNNGDDPLTFGQVSVPAGFSATALPATLAPGASANLVLSVDTRNIGGIQGDLIIASNDPGNGNFSVPLNATIAYSVTLGSATSSKGKTFDFTDADGTLTSVTLNGPGTITPFFTGDNITQTAGKKSTSITADSGLTLQSINLDGTTSGSRLTIKSKGGDGASVIPSLTDSSALNSITARDGKFTGDITLANVNKISIASAQSADISLSSLKNLSLSGDSNFNLNATGAVQNIRTPGALGGIWTVDDINKLSTGAITNLNLESSGSLNNISVRGAIKNSTIQTYEIKKLSAGSMSGSNIKAVYNAPIGGGVTPDVLIGSIVQSLNIKGVFANSNISAATIGKIHFGSISTENSGVNFGLTTDSLTKLTAQAVDKKIKLSRVNANNAAAEIASLGDLGDFKIQIPSGSAHAYFPQS